MLYCAACGVKNCGKEFGTEGTYPKGCPTVAPETKDCLKEYENPQDRLIAQMSAACSPDHSECRILKTIRFAKKCGFQKIGLAFCITLKDEARAVDRIFREAGFEVESIICKVGHESRGVLDIPESCRAMCNPIAQAELLNQAGTEFNIVLGLCVGHDTLFIRHSQAPVTVLAAKDHVYEHAPLEYLKELK